MADMYPVSRSNPMATAMRTTSLRFGSARPAASLRALPCFPCRGRRPLLPDRGARLLCWAALLVSASCLCYCLRGSLAVDDDEYHALACVCYVKFPLEFR